MKTMIITMIGTNIITITVIGIVDINNIVSINNIGRSRVGSMSTLRGRRPRFVRLC